MLAHGLAAGGPGGFPGGHFLGVGHEGRGQGQIEGDVFVEPEAARHLHEQIAAELHAHLAEHGVRRVPHGLLQGDLAVGALLHVGHGRVADVHLAGGVVGGVRRGDVILQRGGQGHHLEGGAGRVQCLGGAVEQLGGIAAAVRGCREQLLVVGGVEGGGGGQGVHGAGLGVQGHHGAHLAGQRVLRRLLDAGIDGKHDVVALGLDARERVHHIGKAGEVLLAAQGVVVGGLDAGGAEALGGVAHDVRRQLAGGVFALVGAVLLAHRCGEYRAVGSGDGAPLHAGLFRDGVVVRRHALVFRRLDDHEVGEVGHEHCEQHREDDHGAGESLAQRHASQHGVRPVGADGPGLAHFGIDAGALVAAAQQAADDDEAGDE